VRSRGVVRHTYAETVDGTTAIQAEAEGAERAGLRVSVSTESDVPYPVEAAVRVDSQARFHPRNYCLGLADAIDAAGGQLLEHTRALASTAAPAA
jgi:hypothetical protein